MMKLYKPLREGWKALEDLYAEGRVRAIGLSNFLPHHIRPLLETAKVKPMLDQLELHAPDRLVRRTSGQYEDPSHRQRACEFRELF